MKRLFSLVLATLLIATMFATFGTVSAAASKKITNTNPAITADVGTTITLSDYSVIFDGDKDATDGLKWADENGKSVTTITPDKKGVTKLVASSGSKKMNVYLVTKEKSEKEYVIYEADFSKYSSINQLRSEGYTIPANDAVCSLQDGTLVLGDKSDGYARVILPEWIGDFGDYSITTEAKMLETTDTGRWFGLVYRIQNTNGKNFPYYHMCVRENTTATNGIEFAERTSSDAWNVATTASANVDSMKSGFHKINVIAYERIVQQSINGNPIMYLNEAIIGKTTALYTKGTVGLTMNYGKIAIKNIKITVQESAPKQTEKKLNLINNTNEELNLLNQIANVQSVSGDAINDVLSQDKVPGGIFFKMSEVADLKAVIDKCIEKKVIPTVEVANTEEASKFVTVICNSSIQDANVISTEASVLERVRAGCKTVRTGLIIDIEGTLTDKAANELRLNIRKAPATFCLIKSEDASHVNVDELQEFAVAVWVVVSSKSDSADYTVEALKAVTSGANGIITDSAEKLAKVINENLEEKSMTRTPIMIGHRGNPSQAPENTLSGFIKAYENGADVFEIDVEITKDGHVIIMHDSTINRTTTYTGTKTVGQMTLDEIKAEFIIGKDGKATTEKVPTLKEVLDEFQDKDCKIFVEFKGSNAKNITETCKLIQEYDMVHKVDVISFNANFLTQTTSKVNIPGMSTGYLMSVSGGSATAEDALTALYPVLKNVQTFKSTINPAHGIITDTFLQATTDRGITVWPWTYNAGSNNVGFLSGCDGVTTDDMQWVKNMVKYLTVAENTNVSVGGNAEHGVLAVTYGNKESSVANDKLIVKVLSGEDCVKIENGTISGVKDGVATVMYGFAARTTSGATYVVYTQPVTITVGKGGNDGDVNNEGNTDVNGYPSNETNDDANGTTDDSSNSTTDDSSNSTLIIVICVVVVLVAIGACAVVVLKKKK